MIHLNPPRLVDQEFRLSTQVIEWDSCLIRPEYGRFRVRLEGSENVCYRGSLSDGYR